MLLVQCPHCGQRQKTAPRKSVMRSRKRCVYCGRSFRVHAGGRDTTIVKELPE